jgi:hypothetical protein
MALPRVVRRVRENEEGSVSEEERERGNLRGNSPICTAEKSSSVVRE